jgi:hypothetical protein
LPVKLVAPCDVGTSRQSPATRRRAATSPEGHLNIDDLLRFLQPLTPAVLPVVVFIWIRTRRELRAIRQELAELRQAPGALGEPRLDDFARAIEAMGTELAHLTQAQRDTMRLLEEREPTRARLAPGTSTESP